MLPIFFSEGKFITSIPLTDRSIHYGDGVFETIAISNNQPELLAEHLTRLKQACTALKIAYAGDDNIIATIKQLLKLHPQQKAILKIIISRGSGGRGYQLPKNPEPRCIYGLYPFPTEVDDFAQNGINVFLCKTKLAYNSSIAGIKHLNRLEQILGAAEFDSSIYPEGFMFDGNEHLIEGTKSNIFIVKQNKLLTPRLNSNGVEGVMKQLIISLANKLNIENQECIIDLTSLKQADEVFICNSIIKIWPVHTIEQQTYSIGPITKKLARALATKMS